MSRLLRPGAAATQGGLRCTPSLRNADCMCQPQNVSLTSRPAGLRTRHHQGIRDTFGQQTGTVTRHPRERISAPFQRYGDAPRGTGVALRYYLRLRLALA